MVPEKHTTKIDWKELRAYIVKLSEETNFADEPEIKFDRMVILTRREFEKEFHFSDLPLYLPDDQIDLIGQAASAWMVKIAWLPDAIPMMLVAYTERDVEEFMDMVIDASAIKSLKERVLERMYFNMLNHYRMFQNKIDEAEFMSERDRENYELVRRKFSTRLALLDNDTQERIEGPRERFNLNLWQMAVLAAGWVVLAVVLIVMVFLKPVDNNNTTTTTNTTTTEPPVTAGLRFLQFGIQCLKLCRGMRP